jgi:transposase
LNLPNDIPSCHKLIKDLFLLVAELREEVAELRSEVKDLKSQLGKTSKNSNKPPSSDGYRKAAKLPKEKHSKGGQKGHKGNTLKFSKEVDLVLKHELGACICGSRVDPSSIYLKEVRQVFDLPEPKLEVLEHQVFEGSCSCCGKKVSGSFPETVKGPVQYGSGVKALVGLLSNQSHLSYAEISSIFKELFGHKINRSTSLKINRDYYKQLNSSIEIIESELEKSLVNHFDETGLRVEGKNHWLHTASNEFYTHLFVHANRGKKALGSEESLLTSYSGRVIHDSWSSYFSYNNCSHGLCGASIIRELEGLIEQGSKWAKKMQALLLYVLVFTRKNEGVFKELNWVERYYDRICQLAQKEEPLSIKTSKRGKLKRTKGRNLLERLEKHQLAVLAFAYYPEVPFANNLAERHIRPAKSKIKIAGCFRTFEGAQYCARIRAFIATCLKQGKNVFQQLKRVCSSESFLTDLIIT